MNDEKKQKEIPMHMEVPFYVPPKKDGNTKPPREGKASPSSEG